MTGDYIFDPRISGNRIPPVHGVSLYQTFAIRQPSDQAVKAACEDVDCPARRKGWDSVIDESTALGAAQAAYIRHQSRRTFTESRTAAGLTVFRFPSGQRCFADHRTTPQLFGVRDGDWRGNPTGRRRVHERPEDWVEHFGEHQLAVAEQCERG